MRKSFRITIAIFVCAVFSCGLFLSGCTGDGQGNIQAFSAKKFAVKNPISVEEVHETEPTEYYGFTTQKTLLVIGGLLDKTVSEKINESLLTAYHMYDDSLPPYTGVKALITENLRLRYKTVSMNVAYNADNVLSVRTYFSWDYISDDVDEKAGEWYSISCCEPRNFDLNTGSEIPLREMFADNSDYMKTVNDFVAAEIEKPGFAGDSEEGWVSMRAPFSGIQEDQKFYLDQNGAITLILDYQTPAFDTKLNYVTLPMPLTGEMVFTERFYDAGKNIYESTEPAVKGLLRFQPPAEPVAISEISLEEGVQFSQRINYSDDCPKAVIDRIDRWILAQPALEEELRGVRDTAVQEGYTVIDGYCGLNISAEHIGSFINLAIYMYGNLYGEKGTEAHALFDKGDSEVSCYRADGTGPLELSDLFQNPNECKRLILSAIKENYEQAEADGYLHYDVDIERYIFEIFEKFEDFVLEDDGIRLNYGDTSSVFLDCLTSDDVRREMEGYGADQILWQGATYVSYAQIGCDNLNIFD